jgi:hypothetical protein
VWFMGVSIFSAVRTRKIQVARQVPPPNAPMLWRTRVRTELWYVRLNLAVGYLAMAMTFVIALEGLLKWYFLVRST